MDGGAWWATVHGVAKSRTRLSDFTFTFHLHASEEEMATHSSVLAWRIPGTGEPGGLPSTGSHRVTHVKRWSTSLTIREIQSKLQCSTTSHKPEWPSSKSLQTINTGEAVEKREPFCTVGGNVNWYSLCGQQYAGPLKN